jgi:L,D-transpeptidase ErfK/SrfK
MAPLLTLVLFTFDPMKSLSLLICCIFSIFFLSVALWTSTAQALTFPLPPAGDDIVGQVQWAQAQPGDTFSSIGRRYDIGYYELVESNPGLDPEHLDPGTIVVIPSRFILPAVSRTGIVINVAELRIYYYPPKRNVVMTYPIGIGREGWVTPLGLNRIIEKTVNPTWNVPESIRADRAKDGVFLPKSVPPGPDNPLGGYRMRLTQSTYLIHGTNDYTGVGRRSSSGCVRMLPEDVEVLFSMVKVGTPVNIVNEPYKAGWDSTKLYLEAHVPLQEQQTDNGVDLNLMRNVVTAATRAHAGELSWSTANQVAQEQNGIPQIIGYVAG